MDLLLPHSRRYSNNSYCKSNIAALRQRGAAAGQLRKKFEALEDINQAGSVAALTELVCLGDRCAASAASLSKVAAAAMAVNN